MISKFSKVRHLAVATFALLALAAIGTAPAHAQITEAQKSAMKANCRSDFIANCMSTKPGTKEALQCLQSNLEKLAPGCQAAVKATMPPPPAAAAPPPAPPLPKAEAAPPPPPPSASPPAAASAPPSPVAGSPPPATVAAPPPPKTAKPKAEKAKTAAPKPVLTPPPPVAATPPPPDPAIVAAKAEKVPLRNRLAVFRACNQDQAAVCPTVKPGGGRMIACLALHPDALSPHCRQTVAGVLE
jgi:hypothetical protein